MAKNNLKVRAAGALLVGLACALGGQPALAQDGPPSDKEMTSAAPSKDGGDENANADAKSKDVEEKHVERVKKIHSLFARLKDQVESMEQVQQAQTNTQLAPDLPPEALAVEDDPAPMPGETSVLDEAPGKAAGKAGKKPGKKGLGVAAVDGEDREIADSAGGSTGTYTVQKGDTLGKIAAKTLGSSKKAAVIAKANGMGVSEPLRVGRSLIIPGGSMAGDAAVGDVAVGAKSKKGKGEVAEKAPAEKGKKGKKGPKNPNSEPVLDYSNYDFKMYQVKPGDNLSKIAKAFYESGNGAELIRKYNKLGAGKDTPLKVGEKILIPLPKQKASDERYEKAKQGVF